MILKHWLKVAILIALPVLAVLGIKQTRWGPMLATPQSRQLGALSSKVLIVEYSDFQCPMCANIFPTVHQMLDLYKGKVRFAYKYYPLTTIHKNAMSSAHAAECAAEQDKFFPYADGLFQHQREWAPLLDPTTWYAALADQGRLKRSTFDACLRDPSKETIIKQDADEARARQVNATPTFIIGDERLVGGLFASDGARTIEKELRK